MRKIISFTHISLDGFVAGLNGKMDWININEEIFDHIAKRVKKGNTALYGRVTYQMMESYWPTAANKPDATRHDLEHSQWYSKVHKIVLSRTIKDEGLANTTIINDNFLEEITQLKQQDGADILLFGSPRATHSLIQENLIDGYWLFVNPVILGDGIPLFKNVKEGMKLKLLTTRQFACGVTELSYLIDK